VPRTDQAPMKRNALATLDSKPCTQKDDRRQLDLAVELDRIDLEIPDLQSPLGIVSRLCAVPIEDSNLPTKLVERLDELLLIGDIDELYLDLRLFSQYNRYRDFQQATDRIVGLEGADNEDIVEVRRPQEGGSVHERMPDHQISRERRKPGNAAPERKR
jgi:hypothetical protein